MNLLLNSNTYKNISFSKLLLFLLMIRYFSMKLISYNQLESIIITMCEIKYILCYATKICYC